MAELTLFAFRLYLYITVVDVPIDFHVDSRRLYVEDSFFPLTPGKHE
jgi:hypothetical protein